MKLLWGAKRLGVLTKRWLSVEDGKCFLRDDEVKQFTLYGVVFGMCFFGFQKAKLVKP